MTRVYKILTAGDWAEAVRTGAFTGAEIDARDGYIHLSTAEQAAETARLHFQRRPDLVLVGFEAEALGDALKWEPSRGGQLFPHLYGVLAASAAISVTSAPLDGEGVPMVPPLTS